MKFFLENQGYEGSKDKKGEETSIPPAIKNRINDVEQQALLNVQNLTDTVQELQEKIEILGENLSSRANLQASAIFI